MMSNVVQNGSSHNSANLIRKMHGCKINACNAVYDNNGKKDKITAILHVLRLSK